MNPFQLVSRVHFGLAGSFWSQTFKRASFGDGNGTTTGPLVSLDIVGHEFTHGLTELTAGLSTNPATEAAAANESFSDIFGTMVEFSASAHPNYTIAEDTYFNGTNVLRSMKNPRLDCQFQTPCSLDHYSQYNPAANPPMDIHFVSGIQNVAFWLLAEGGPHPSSGVNVKRISRDNAAAIYFRALTTPGYLTSTAHFSDVRAACERAARDIFSAGNPIYQAVQKSWYASGVGGDVPVNSIDNAQSFVRQQYLDFLNREPDQAGSSFWTNEITSCGNDAVCEDA